MPNSSNKQNPSSEQKKAEKSYKSTRISLFLLLTFIGVMLIQILIPANIIFKQENILNQGKAYKMKLNPVDPVDMFRGNYVILNFAENKIELSASEFLQFSAKKYVYAIYTQDKNGFLKLSKLKNSRPEADNIFIKTRIESIHLELLDKCKPKNSAPKQKTLPDCVKNNHKHIGVLDYSFDRFYLQEFKAKKIDKLFANLNKTHSAYVLIRIKNGSVALEDLKINQKSVLDFKN